MTRKSRSHFYSPISCSGIPIQFSNPNSKEDKDKYKSDVVKNYLHKRRPDWNIESYQEYYMYGDQEKIDTVIQGIDIIIAGLDNSRFIYKLMNKSKIFTKPLLILDIENLNVTTHAVIPTGNVDDIIGYKELLKKKMNKRRYTL